MFNESSITKMFERDQLPNLVSLKQLFFKLAHSSIMRLNEISMNKVMIQSKFRSSSNSCTTKPRFAHFFKRVQTLSLSLFLSLSSGRSQLFDLIVMVFKYQLVACGQPSDLLQLTVNHLQAIERMSDKSPARLPVQLVNQKLLKRFGATSLWQLTRSRQALLNYLTGVRTKVSVLLRLQLQTDSGSVRLTPNGRVTCHCQLPGQVVHFRSDGQVLLTERFDCVGQYELDESGTTLGINM
jgi:hypothetical protein